MQEHYHKRSIRNCSYETALTKLERTHSDTINKMHVHKHTHTHTHTHKQKIKIHTDVMIVFFHPFLHPHSSFIFCQEWWWFTLALTPTVVCLLDVVQVGRTRWCRLLYLCCHGTQIITMFQEVDTVRNLDRENKLKIYYSFHSTPFSKPLVFSWLRTIEFLCAVVLWVRITQKV